MTEAVDRILSDPHRYYVLGDDGVLRVRRGTTWGLSRSELVELVSYRDAIRTILTLEPGPDGSTDAPSAPETNETTDPMPSPAPATGRPHSVRSDAPRADVADGQADLEEEQDVSEVVVQLRGGPGRIVARRSMQELQEQARRQHETRATVSLREQLRRHKTRR